MARGPDNVKRVTKASIEQVRGIQCPRCGYEYSFVNYTRHYVRDGQRTTVRSRTCRNVECGYSFLTNEGIFG